MLNYYYAVHNLKLLQKSFIDPVYNIEYKVDFKKIRDIKNRVYMKGCIGVVMYILKY